MRTANDPAPELLRGGRNNPAVVRIGDTVRRPQVANAPFVHDLLLYLEQVGFDGAPRFLGVDAEGREILTYLEGTVANGWEPGAWTDEQLQAMARLLRRYHDATAESPLVGTREVVCHNDFAPWNTVFVAGLPVAVIDFDGARPGPRLRDLAYVFWCWLAPGTAAVSIPEHIRRLRLICAAYGCPTTPDLVTQLAEWQQEMLAEHLRKGWLDLATRVQREIAWLQDHAAEFRGCL